MIISKNDIVDIFTLVKEIENVNERFNCQIWWRGTQDYEKHKLVPSVFRQIENFGDPALAIKILKTINEYMSKQFDKGMSGEMNDIG